MNAAACPALPVESAAPWTAERLRDLLHDRPHGEQVIVVSNREPYVHERSDAGVTVTRPAGGLVTALEPIVRACGGTWIAHGGGNADAEFVDEADICRVPPGAPDYALRRIWLSVDEQQGYNDGFANTGLWPLCHLAHVQPVFTEAHWRHYVNVNERFADAVAEEATTDDPVVLVQDYHFALLPALIRCRLPRATVIAFWHIPWPNPDQFAICPWHKELLRGLLGASIVGLQTRADRRNFEWSVERFLGRDADVRDSRIRHGGGETLVRDYPISIAWPSTVEAVGRPASDARQGVDAAWGLSPDTRLIVGVDRFDYTKGLLERLRAVEHLLATHPEWIGALTLAQIAAPTRTGVPEYATFQRRVRAEAERINARFAGTGAVPILLLAEHRDRSVIDELYRAADACVVTSLHDGMNLVCKEFVAARDDEQGVLVLSRFAGAAAELKDALLINPYHVEQTAATLLRALDMPAAEQRRRMRRLRATVRDANIFRWAGTMLLDAAEVRARGIDSAPVRALKAV